LSETTDVRTDAGPASDGDVIDSASATARPKRRPAGLSGMVLAERSLLAELEADCTAPIGALAEIVESIDDDGRIFDELSLRACAAAVDGSDVLRASVVGPPTRAAELGRELARELLDLGARELLSVPEPEPAGSLSEAVNSPATDFSNSSPMENCQ